MATMWFAIGLALLLLWLVAKIFIGIASAAVHLALVAGIAFIVAHFAAKVSAYRRGGGPAPRGA